MDKVTGEPLHGKCKHAAAVLLMIEAFVEKGTLDSRTGCTDNLQNFHEPKKMYEGVYNIDHFTCTMHTYHVYATPPPFLNYRNSFLEIRKKLTSE